MSSQLFLLLLSPGYASTPVHTVGSVWPTVRVNGQRDAPTGHFNTDTTASQETHRWAGNASSPGHLRKFKVEIKAPCPREPRKQNASPLHTEPWHRALSPRQISVALKTLGPLLCGFSFLRSSGDVWELSGRSEELAEEHQKCLALKWRLCLHVN